jgi:Rod binding domain-containing protein
MSELISNLASAGESLSQARSEKAVRALQNPSSTANGGKIEKAARDFESILVGQWLEQAEKSFATVPGEDPDQQADSGRDQFLGVACQSLAQGLSQTGAFGIARMIEKKLKGTEKEGQGSSPAIQGSSKPKI